MVQNHDDYNPFAAPASDLSPEPFLETSSDLQYAGFGARFGAEFIDGIIIRIASTVLGFFVFGLMGHRADINQVSSVVSLIFTWLYYALQESSAAEATLGKRLFKIRVLDLSGKRLTFGRATGRLGGKILSVLTLMLGYLIQPFTARRQALHDILAGTIVVKGVSSVRTRNEVPPVDLPD